MKNWFKRFKAWTLHWADTKWGVWALFIVAFADASFFGLPTPVLFLALALINIKKIFAYVLYGTLGTLSGALAGYAIGHFAWLNASGEFTGLAQFLFNNIPGFSVAVYDKIQTLYTKWDFWVLFVAAALPLPFKIFSISSGVFDINLLIFCIATFISQGLKYVILALLTIKLGPEVKKLFTFNWKPVAIILTATIAVTLIILRIF
jgi:membrane protein YqaA with SNARE-associated domain